MIKRLLLFLCLYVPFISIGQHTVEGVIADYSGVVAQLKGDYYTFFKNNQNAIGHLNGQVITENISVPSQGFRKGVLDIQHGVYFAETKEGIGLFSLSGEKLSGLVFSKFKPFVTNNTIVEAYTSPTNKEYLYIDKAGKVLASYNQMKYYKIFGIDITKGFHNTDSFIAKGVFFPNDDFRPFSEGLTPVKNPQTKLWGFADQQLTLTVPADYKQVSLFFEGKASVQNQNDIWGFIDQKGEVVVPFKFSIQPSKFSSGLARVMTKDAKLGYVDVEGNVIIEPIYDYVTDFYKGFSLVRKSLYDPIQMIDTTGQTLYQFDSKLLYVDTVLFGANPKSGEDTSFHYAETLVQLVEMGKGIFIDDYNNYGILNIHGETVLAFDYLSLKDYSEGKMFAIQDVEVNGTFNRVFSIIEDTGVKLIEFVESRF